LSRTYVLDTKPDPHPRAVREIKADELATQAGCSRPRTIHCGPGDADRAAQLIAELLENVNAEYHRIQVRPYKT
jgi:hypothetical protein